MPSAGTTRLRWEIRRKKKKVTRIFRIKIDIPLYESTNKNVNTNDGGIQKGICLLICGVLITAGPIFIWSIGFRYLALHLNYSSSEIYLKKIYLVEYKKPRELRFSNGETRQETWEGLICAIGMFAYLALVLPRVLRWAKQFGLIGMDDPPRQNQP